MNTSWRNRIPAQILLALVLSAWTPASAKATEFELSYRHSGSIAEVEQALRQVETTVLRKRKLHTEWGPSVLRMSREGLDGQIRYNASTITIRIQLSGKLQVLTSIIRRQIDREFSKQMAKR